MYAKVHERVVDGMVSRVVAVCDRELVGRVLKQGSATLDLKTYKNFYCGEPVDETTAIELIKSARNLNLVGKKSVEAARKALAIDAKAVKKIAGVPHIQIYYV